MEDLHRFREAVAGAIVGIRAQKEAAAKEVAQREVAMQVRSFTSHSCDDASAACACMAAAADVGCPISSRHCRGASWRRFRMSSGARHLGLVLSLPVLAPARPFSISLSM